MADGVMHDDLMALGRNLATQNAVQQRNNIMFPNTNFVAPDPFSGVSPDSYSRFFASDIRKSEREAGAVFARRATQESNRRLAGDFIGDAAFSVGGVIGGALAAPLGPLAPLGFMAGGFAASGVAEQMLNATGFFDFDPLVTLDQQAQAMVDSSVHRFAYGLGGVGMDRGISFDEARDIGGDVFDQFRDRGFHGVEASRAVDVLSQYGNKLHMGTGTGDIAKQLEEYLDGVMDIVKRTGDTIERASQMAADAKLMGVSGDNVGNFYGTISDYSNIAGINPNQMIAAGQQHSAAFASTGFGYGDIMTSFAGGMANAGMMSAASGNARLWDAIGGPAQFGMHQAQLGSAFVSNPAMWGKLMGGGTFDQGSWDSMMAGRERPDSYGDAYGDLNKNDQLVAQYQGLQEMMSRPDEWTRAATGSLFQQMASDDITDFRAQSMWLYQNQYAPNLATARQDVAAHIYNQGPDASASRLITVQRNQDAASRIADRARFSETMDVFYTMGEIYSETNQSVFLDWSEGSQNLGDAMDKESPGLMRESIIENVGRIRGLHDLGVGDLALDSSASSFSAVVAGLTGTDSYRVSQSDMMSYIGTLDVGSAERKTLEETFIPLHNADATLVVRDQAMDVYTNSDYNRARVAQRNIDAELDRVNYAEGLTTGSAQFGIAYSFSKVQSWLTHQTGVSDSPNVGRDGYSTDVFELSMKQVEEMEALYDSHLGDSISGGLDFLSNVDRPTSALAMYARQTGWHGRLSQGERNASNQFASNFNSTLEEQNLIRNQLDSDQVNRNLNMWQTPSGMDAGWQSFLDKVADSGAAFEEGGSFTDRYDSFANDVYGVGTTGLSASQEGYINTYLGTSGVGRRAQKSLLDDSLLDAAMAATTSEGYDTTISSIRRQTRLSEGEITDVALYGTYRSQSAQISAQLNGGVTGEARRELVAQKAEYDEAMNLMTLSDEGLQQRYSESFGLISSIAGSEDMVIRLAGRGGLDEQIARADDVWRRATGGMGDIMLQDISLKELQNMNRTEIAEYIDLDRASAYDGMSGILERINAGETVTDSDVLAHLQNIADMNPDAPKENAPEANGSSDENSMWVRISESSENSLATKIALANSGGSLTPSGDGDGSTTSGTVIPEAFSNAFGGS